MTNFFAWLSGCATMFSVMCYINLKRKKQCGRNYQNAAGTGKDMRIEYKEENEQENKSTPEPEIIHESDLTRQEKRRMEWEKIKGLGWKKRLPYLWTYYKIWLWVPVILIVVITSGIQMYHNSQEEQVLYVNVSGTVLESDEGTQRLSADLLKLCGNGGKYETVPITTNILSGDDYTASLQMSIWLSSGDMDILICDEETCKGFQEQGLFMDWAELGDNGILQKYIQNGILYLENENWTQYGLVTYEPVCAGVLNTSRRPEAACKALLYLCGDV